MNICLVISQLKLYVHITHFFFHYCYNLIVGFILLFGKNQMKPKPKHHINLSVLSFKRKFVSRICALIKLECLLVAHLRLQL